MSRSSVSTGVLALMRLFPVWNWIIKLQNLILYIRFFLYNETRWKRDSLDKITTELFWNFGIILEFWNYLGILELFWILELP